MVLKDWLMMSAHSGGGGSEGDILALVLDICERGVGMNAARERQRGRMEQIGSMLKVVCLWVRHT